MKKKIEPCRFLKWDTDFFGFRIARINKEYLDQDFLNRVFRWCRDNDIECLYFLADSDDPKTITLAEDNGFHLVEVRITLERSLKEWPPDSLIQVPPNLIIRPSCKDDIPLLLRIGGGSYLDSRFYLDPCFPQEKCRAYYETWIKKSCKGRADLVLVAEMKGQVVGYITGVVARDKPEGFVELLSVKPAMRKIGVGQELVKSLLDWFNRKGVSYVKVVTQGRNIAAQRIFQRLGFSTYSCQLYYHKWFFKSKNKKNT